jgi:hypothetical protein
MLRLEGVVLSVIRHKARTANDGKAYEAYSQVQLQVEELLENEQVRYGIHTLTTASPDAFEELAGASVTIPVRVYVKAGSVAFTMPPNAVPEALDRSGLRAVA